MVKHPRYYFFDPGVLNGLLGSFTASADRVGTLFEHLAVSQLWATAAAYDRDLSLYAFRTRGGLEVDFIARFHHTLWAIEAKATERVTDRDAAPLLAAKTYLPNNAHSVIVIPKGPRRRLACGVDVLSLADLLSTMVAG